MKNNRHGQIVSMDLLLAVMIFAILSIFIIIMWDGLIFRIDNNLNENQMINVAFAFSDYLIKNPGDPSDWDPSLVAYIGLADRDRMISTTKFNYLSTLNYGNTKSLFKMDLFDYNYLINITTLNQKEIASYPLNLLPNPKTKSIIKIRRYVFYDNKEALLYLTLWK